MIKWKLSAGWANNKKCISCLNEHVKKGCGGCCWSQLSSSSAMDKKRFPVNCSKLIVFGEDIKKYIDNDHYEKLKDSKYGIQVCEYLEPGVGCKLSSEQKPITCTLFPFVLNKNNTLVLFGRSLLKNYRCYKNINVTNKSTIENNKNDFINLFGEKQTTEAIYSVKQGKDYYFELTDKFVEDFNNENESVRNGIFPIRKTK